MNKPPVQSCTCDMPACCRKDSDWKLFTGCFHSFHTECLKGIDSFPICSAHLKTVITKLSSTAQNSVFSPDHKNEKEVQKEQDASNKAPRINEDEAIESLDAKGKKNNDDILAIEIPDLQHLQHPDTQQFTSLQLLKQARPPHCKTCGHPVKGHQVLNGLKKCPLCENQKCAVNSKGRACLCEWHLKSNCGVVKRTNYNIETIQHQTTIEYLFPSELCQYRLSILVLPATLVQLFLAGLKFLQGELDISSGNIDIQQFAKRYKEITIEGNTLHSIINPPHDNPNLSVEDVLSSIDLPLLEEPFIAVNNASNFTAEL